MSRQAPEAVIKTAIREYLDSVGIYWCHIQAGIGSKVGDPDLVVCIDGRFVGMEVKTRTGRQSYRQTVVATQIEESGGVYAIVRSVDDVKHLIKHLRQED